jgi:hypothetical protein
MSKVVTVLFHGRPLALSTPLSELRRENDSALLGDFERHEKLLDSLMMFGKHK